MKKIVFLTLMMFIFSSAKAYCDSSETSRLSKLINNINVNYEYDYQSKDFIITFSNLTLDFVVTDLNDNNDYTSYDELEFNNINSGIHRYKIYSKKCSSIISFKNITLPYYNEYFDSVDCKGIQDYSYCNKWISNKFSYNTFKENVDKYRESINKEKEKEEVLSKKSILDIIGDIIREFYVKYYIILLPMIILALCAIIYLKNKIDQIL